MKIINDKSEKRVAITTLESGSTYVYKNTPYMIAKLAVADGEPTSVETEEKILVVNLRDGYAKYVENTLNVVPVETTLKMY